jgi:hypothetical protein
MISDAEVIMNRCGRAGCGTVMIFMARRQLPMTINEFAGNTPCERLGEHDMSEWTRVTVLRDVIILRALWTVGRSVTPGLLSDPTSHILADWLGWKIGDRAEITSLPGWMRDGMKEADLTWEGVMLAKRVAIGARDEWPTDHRLFGRLDRIVSYLDTWSDKVH